MWKAAFKKSKGVWSALSMVSFLKAVFHKFYLVHYWILCLKYARCAYGSVGHLWRSWHHIVCYPNIKFVYPIRGNSWYIMWALTKIQIFLKRCVPSEGHAIIIYNSSNHIYPICKHVSRFVLVPHGQWDKHENVIDFADLLIELPLIYFI